MKTEVTDLTTYSRTDLITDTTDMSVEHQDIISKSISNGNGLPAFKAENFVGNAQITPYAKVKQYMLEISSREDVIEQMEYDTKKCKVKLNRLKTEAEKLSGFDLEDISLDIEHEDRNYKKLLHKLKAAYEERQTYLDLIEKFNQTPEGKYEDGRLLIDVIGDKEVSEKLEAQHWTYRLAKQAAMDMVAYGRIGVGNMDAIAMMSPGQQEATLQLASEYLVRNEQRLQMHLSNANEMAQKGITSAPYRALLGLTKED